MVGKYLRAPNMKLYMQISHAHTVKITKPHSWHKTESAEKLNVRANGGLLLTVSCFCTSFLLQTALQYSNTAPALPLPASAPLTLSRVLLTHIPLRVSDELRPCPCTPVPAPLSRLLMSECPRVQSWSSPLSCPWWFYYALTLSPWTLSGLTCPSADSYFLSQTCSSHPPSHLSHANSILLVLKDKTLVILDSSFPPYPVGKFLQLYFENSEHFLSSLQLTRGPSHHQLLLSALASLLAFS